MIIIEGFGALQVTDFERFRTVSFFIVNILTLFAFRRKEKLEKSLRLSRVGHQGGVTFLNFWPIKLKTNLLNIRFIITKTANFRRN